MFFQNEKGLASSGGLFFQASIEKSMRRYPLDSGSGKIAV